MKTLKLLRSFDIWENYLPKDFNDWIFKICCEFARKIILKKSFSFKVHKCLLMGKIFIELGLKFFNRGLVILFEIVLKLVGNGLDFLWKFEKHQPK